MRNVRVDAWLAAAIRLAAFAGIVLDAGLAQGTEGRDGVRRPTRPPPPPFVLTCAPEGPAELSAAFSDAEGARIPVLADAEFGAEWGYGYAGGKGFRHWRPAVWGYDPAPFSSGRIDPGSYRFSLQKGDYLVVLGFCESFEHHVRRRILDVLIQGRVVEADLDLFALAGCLQAFQSKHLVSVHGDEGLTIEFRTKGGSPPLVNAIWVYPAPAKPPPPSPPSGFRATGSYGMNVLFWEHSGVKTTAGYRIERRPSDAGALSPARPVPVARWIDRDVTPGRTYEYRIRSVDLWGRSGEWSPPSSATPRDFGHSTLPVYSIEVSEEGLAYLHGDVREDRTVLGRFSVGDSASYPVEIQTRGASSRLAAKLSYRCILSGMLKIFSI